MSRGARLLGAATALAVVLAVLFWLARARTPAASAGAAEAEPPVGLAVLPAPPRAAAAAATPLPPLPEGDVQPEVARGDKALQAMGRRCWEQRTPLATEAGQPNETTQSLRVSFTLIVDGGEGRVEAPQIVDSRMMDPELERCLLEGMLRTRWPSDGPRGAVLVTELFRMGDFTVPIGPPSSPPPGY
jgi:hypothetical protein